VSESYVVEDGEARFVHVDLDGFGQLDDFV
jgi:hypothetical protein